jgi:hypothetical protein
MLATTGGVYLLSAAVKAGVGSRVRAGGLEGGFPCAHQVAVTWVALHAARIRYLLGQKGKGSLSPLFTRKENAVLSIAQVHCRKRGQSGGACVALGFILALGQFSELSKRNISITGRLDLRGAERGRTGRQGCLGYEGPRRALYSPPKERGRPDSKRLRQPQPGGPSAGQEP